MNIVLHFSIDLYVVQVIHIDPRAASVFIDRLRHITSAAASIHVTWMRIDGAYTDPGMLRSGAIRIVTGPGRGGGS